MKYNKFIELDREIEVLYEQKKFKEAIEVFEEGLSFLPEKEIEDNYFTIAWNKSVLYSECKMYDECMEVMEECINQGYSFPISFRRFEPLKQKKGYEDLVTKNNKLISAISASAKSEYVVHLPENYDKEKRYPLFMALHGDGICNIEEFSTYWKPDAFLANNFIFAYVQSSQTICHNGHMWLDNMETARKDIKECYDKISKEYLIDESNILIGGFSGGAMTSVDFTLSNILPIKGFIALCPEEKTEAFTKENVELAASKGIKGVFMEGELVLPMEEEEEMLKAFDEAGLQHEYYINKGIGHRAPDDFNEKLSRAIKFIVN